VKEVIEMKVAVLTQDGFEVRDLAIPPYGPDEVLVETVACGVCGGDLFAYRTRFEPEITESVMGHEGSGIVAAIGRDVEEFAEGDVVTAIGGAYADYFVVKADSLVKLPEKVDPVYALGEPIACCVHAGNRFGVERGDCVAVVGCGFMGLVCLQLARYQGAGFICGIDPLAYRREVSIQLGADEATEPEHWRVEDPLRGGEFDVVIEAAGVQGAIDLSSDLVRQHGRIILVGYHQSNGGTRTVNMKQWNYKAIDVVNGHVRRGEEKLEAMRVGMELMSTGDLLTEPLVTCYELDEVEQAFQDLIDRREGILKAVLVTSGD
jgi:threonine dehydrogenase-like Zn-dependent dehydrogenase